MVGMHIITLAVLSDKNLTPAQISKIAETMTMSGMAKKVLYSSEFSFEDHAKEMINKGIKDGIIGNAHIHIEQTEIEEDSMPEEICTYVKHISDHKTVPEFAHFFRNCSYSEQQSILGALTYLNDNMITPKTPRFTWKRVGISKGDLINLINIGNILRECVGR